MAKIRSEIVTKTKFVSFSGPLILSFETVTKMIHYSFVKTKVNEEDLQTTTVSRVSAHGRLNIACYLGPHVRLPRNGHLLEARTKIVVVCHGRA